MGSITTRHRAVSLTRPHVNHPRVWSSILLVWHLRPRPGEEAFHESCHHQQQQDVAQVPKAKKVAIVVKLPVLFKLVDALKVFGELFLDLWKHKHDNSHNRPEEVRLEHVGWDGHGVIHDEIRFHVVDLAASRFVPLVEVGKNCAHL